MGYKVIYLDGKEGRPKKNCKVCEELKRNVIEPVAVFLPEDKNLTDLPDEELEKFDTCIFHCEKEDKTWMKNLEEYEEWKKRRDKANAKGEEFNEPFEIKWEKNLVKEFWSRLRAYCFAVDYWDEWKKADGNWNIFISNFIFIPIQRDRLEFYLGSLTNSNSYDFSFFDFPSFFTTFNPFQYKTPKKEFSKRANFSGAKFHQKADFSEAQFQQEADFSRAEFQQEANFSRAQFHKEANLSRVQFHQKAYFTSTFFKETALLDLKGRNFCFVLTSKPNKSQIKRKKAYIVFSPKLTKESHIEIRNLDIYRLKIEDFANITRNLLFFDCKVSSRGRKGSKPNLLIKNSILGELRLINCDFSKAEKIRIENSELTEVKFANVNWGEISENRICPDLFKDHPEKAKDVYRQLKLAHDNQKDHITANEFYALEMKAYERELYKEVCKNKGKIPIFTIHKAISNFGQSWLRPLILLLLITIGYSGFSYEEYFAKYQNELPSLMATILLLQSLISSWKDVTTVAILLVFILFLLSYLSYRIEQKRHQDKEKQPFSMWFKMDILPKIAASFVWLCFIFIGIIGIKGLIGLFYQLTNQCGLNYQESISFILDETARKLNIFNRLGKGHSTSAFIETLYFITTSFLIYQIIVAVRRQVRR